MAPTLVACRGERLWLSPEKCLFWEAQRTLVLADLHVGKSAHFRKAGIAIPQHIFQEDMHRLFQQIHLFNPDRLLIVGDLFHSHENREHAWFSTWRESIQSKEVVLVKGNHEILLDESYEKLGLTIVERQFEQGPFAFTHILPAQRKSELFYFSGHVHPGVKLSGRGKQSFTFPCFHFTEQTCTLPAFSNFTGMKKVQPQKGDRIFASVTPKGAGSTLPMLTEVRI